MNTPRARFPRAIVQAFAAALLATAQLAAAADAPATEPAHWQKVPLDLSYSGLTTYYSCFGIEGKVKILLEALGARSDARVVATGCEQGIHMHVSQFAFLRGEFQVLVPGEGATPEDTVQAQWQPVEIRANRPFTVGEGDCELVEQLKPVIEKAFTLREASYTTSCMPHSVSTNSFGVKAKVLKVPKAPKAPKG